MISRAAARTTTSLVSRRGFHATRARMSSPYHYPEGPYSNIPFNPRSKWFGVGYWTFMATGFFAPFGIAGALFSLTRACRPALANECRSVEEHCRVSCYNQKTESSGTATRAWETWWTGVYKERIEQLGHRGITVTRTSLCLNPSQLVHTSATFNKAKLVHTESQATAGKRSSSMYCWVLCSAIASICT